MATRADIIAADATAKLVVEMEAIKQAHAATQRTLAEERTAHAATVAAHANERANLLLRIADLEAHHRVRDAADAAVATQAALQRERAANDAEKRRITELVRAGKMNPPARV